MIYYGTGFTNKQDIKSQRKRWHHLDDRQYVKEMHPE